MFSWGAFAFLEVFLNGCEASVKTNFQARFFQERKIDNEVLLMVFVANMESETIMTRKLGMMLEVWFSFPTT